MQLKIKSINIYVFEDIDTNSENLVGCTQTFHENVLIDYDLEYGEGYYSDSSYDSDTSMKSVLSQIDELHVTKII